MENIEPSHVFSGDIPKTNIHHKVHEIINNNTINVWEAVHTKMENTKSQALRETIVGPAWDLVMHTSFLKKFNFFPSLLSTIYLGCIILYQLAFAYVYIFKLKDQFFALIIQWVHTSYFWQVIIALAIGIILYLFITPVAEWGLISLIAKREEESKNGINTAWGLGYGISRGLMNFLPIFELSNALSIFKLLSIITFYIFLLRIFWQGYFISITIIMTLYLGFAFLINILFAYAKFFIIFENKKAIESLSLSVQMALSNLSITFHLYFTLLLVYIRTFITTLIFIIFPFVISGLFTYVTISLLQILSIGILSILFIVLLVFISHLNSVLEIFVEAIWYNAYKENKKHFQSTESHH